MSDLAERIREHAYKIETALTADPVQDYVSAALLCTAVADVLEMVADERERHTYYVTFEILRALAEELRR